MINFIIQEIEKRTNEKINTGLDEVTIRNKTMEQYLERTKDVAIQYNNIKKYLIYDLNISTYDCYIYTECYELTTINKYIEKTMNDIDMIINFVESDLERNDNDELERDINHLEQVISQVLKEIKQIRQIEQFVEELSKKYNSNSIKLTFDTMIFETLFKSNDFKVFLTLLKASNYEFETNSSLAYLKNANEIRIIQYNKTVAYLKLKDDINSSITKFIDIKLINEFLNNY